MKHIAHGEVDAFNDAVALGVANHGGFCLDAITGEAFLELTACKFCAIVMYDTVRAVITAQPVAVEEDADVVAALIFRHNKFRPAGGFVNNGKHLYFFN